MNKPKPRCRVRGFVEEMGAFLQRPYVHVARRGANRPRPHNNENSGGFQISGVAPISHRAVILAVVPYIPIAWPGVVIR